MDAGPPQNAKRDLARDVKLHRMKTRFQFPRLSASRKTTPYTIQPFPPAACGIAISPETFLRGRSPSTILPGPCLELWSSFLSRQKRHLKSARDSTDPMHLNTL